jgi:hypothetical protein
VKGQGEKEGEEKGDGTNMSKSSMDEGMREYTTTYQLQLDSTREEELLTCLFSHLTPPYATSFNSTPPGRRSFYGNICMLEGVRWRGMDNGSPQRGPTRIKLNAPALGYKKR